MRNATTKADKHEQPNGKSEPPKHLKDNPEHKFVWMILSRIPSRRIK